MYAPFANLDIPEAIIQISQDLPLADARNQAIEDFERQYLKDLLSRYEGKINQAADQAKVSSRQLHRMLIKYGIDKNEFKPLKTSKKSLDILNGEVPVN